LSALVRAAVAQQMLELGKDLLEVWTSFCELMPVLATCTAFPMLSSRLMISLARTKQSALHLFLLAFGEPQAQFTEP
jgi:hypothetical protein